MLEWSEYFYWKLLESQRNFAQSMNIKTEWNFFKVLKSRRAKQNLPIYNDLAIHKVVEKEYNINIPKATISTWLDRIPVLLEQDKVLSDLLDEKKIQKEETRYTKSEWDELHKREWYQVNIEYRAMMAKLNNPNLTDIELMKLTWATQRLVNKINNYWITMNDIEKQKQLVQLNEQIIMLWNERLLREIEKMPAFSFKDLKALSGIVDDVFKQNRLLTGQSTENVAHGLDDVYEAILKKAEIAKLNPGFQKDEILDWEIETSRIKVN